MNDWRGISKREWMERAIAAEARVEELEADWLEKNDILTQTAKVMEFAEEFKARAETAEALLTLADRYGADQWRRGNAGQEPQEFDEWRREAQP